ncbi:MAG: hypothetical protein ACRDD8_03625, partial [Bacteroidales bacterium]
MPINDYSNEVVYGVNKDTLEEVKAIVVHSTANPGVGVKSHVKWGKENPNALLTMYYVDSKEIGKMTKDGMAGYGIKTFE